MARYFFEISFLGSAYHGWQIQKNAQSVQSLINDKLSVILRKNIETTGCGRTDTGVHATQFFFHADIDELNYPPEELLFKLNGILPPDISVNNLYPVEANKHARFDALKRTYTYLIHTRKNPFLHNRSWLLYKLPDITIMNKACNLLLNNKDFAAFCKSNSNNKTTLCMVYEAFWKKNETGLEFKISANRFLRNMVRAIVGTMVALGKNEITIAEFEQIIQSKNRKFAGESAPACGLYLSKVEYDFIKNT
jgi:tRNA pseudouridine38-40 synthase